MVNKIISILALCVVGLAIVAYSLWDEGNTQAAIEPKIAKEEASKENNEVQPDESLPEAENVKKNIEQKEQVPTPDVTKEESAEDKDEVDEKLCELAHQYSDWYPKNDSYESEQLMQDVKAWAYSYGYFETEYSHGAVGIKKQSDYDYYEMDDLKEMAKAGDSMANVRLAYRLYLQGDTESMRQAQPYCDRAIVDGYTALVMCKSSYIASQVYKERQKEGDEADPEKLRQLELEFQAWTQTSSALKDKLSSKMAEALLADTEFEFEEEEVAQHSQIMVKEIQEKRQRLGIEDIQHPPMPKLLEYVLDNEKDIQEKLNACFE